MTGFRPQFPKPEGCNCQHLEGVHDIGCDYWESASAWKLVYPRPARTMREHDRHRGGTVSIRDRITRKAREGLEAQIAPGEEVVLSANLAASALVLTNRRLMVAPAVEGSEASINVPLGAVQNVAWKKGILGSPGVLTIHTGSETHDYKVRNNEGSDAAVKIRQAIAAR